MRRLLPRMHYKLDGKLVVPCDDFIAWAIWYETADRVVAQTQVGPLEVSTVFLGLDYNFSLFNEDNHEPLTFETMVFGDQDVMLQLGEHKRLFRTTLDYQMRYASWDEAEKGHKIACEWARARLAEIDVKMQVTNDGTVR